MIKKICPNCNFCKTSNEFPKHKNRKDGMGSWCKACGKIQYNKNKEKYLLQKSKYWYENQDLMKKRNRRHYTKDIRKNMYTSAKRRAKLKNIPFNLDVEDIIIPQICPILKIPLVSNETYSKFNSPSLDRIFPEKGYVKDNIIVISLKANQIKNCSTIEELEQVYNFYKILIGSL